MKHLLNFGHFFESVGVVVKAGLIRKELVLEAWNDIIVGGWTQFEPVTAIFRRTQDPIAYEAFEYLTVLARRWQNNIPTARIPRTCRTSKSTTCTQKPTTNTQKAARMAMNKTLIPRE